MCSGPAFIGFYLKFISLADDLYLFDINDDNRRYINQTIKDNELKDVRFIHSDVFDSFEEEVVFDTIVSNPPMFKRASSTFWYENNEYLLAIDEDWRFHKKFFRDVVRFMDSESRIIMIENHHGMSLNELALS